MSQEQEPKRKGKWPKRIAVGVCALVVLAGVLIVAGQVWIIPAVARSQIRSAAADYWAGDVAFGEFEFSYFGPVRVRDLQLRDEGGRTWARVESVSLTLRDMPGVHPLLSDVVVDGVELTAHFRDGRCEPPLLEPPEPEPSRIGEYVDLQRVTIRNVTVGVADDRGQSLRTVPLHADLVREGGVYRLDAAWGSGDAPPLVARGSIDPAGPVDVTCTIRETLSEPTGRTLLAILGSETLRAVAGRVEGEVRLQGLAAKPDGMRPDGDLKLRNWQVTTDHGELVRDFSGNVSVGRADAIEVDATDLRASVADGTLAGVLELHAQPDDVRGTFGYEAHADLAEISVPELSRLLRGEATGRQGTLSGRLDLRGTGLGLDDLNGSGTLVLSDANVHDIRFGLLEEVFDQIKLGRILSKRKADVKVVFELDHGVVTLAEPTKVALPVGSLAVRKGGTVNLPTHHLDLLVVGGPLSQMESVFTKLKLPFVDLVAELAQRLTAVRIEGNWDDPPSRLVQRVPIQELDEALVDFFRQTVRTGGELPAEALDVFGKVLTAPVKLLESVNGQRSDEASQPAR